MDDANGTLKGPRALEVSKPTTGVNGATKSPLNGHAAGRKNMARTSRPGILSRVVTIIARYASSFLIAFGLVVTFHNC